MTQITIPSVPTEVEYSVTVSSTGPFTVPFPFFSEEDVKATVTDALAVVTELVVDTDFSFTTKDTPVGQEGSGYTGGTITLNSAIGADGATTIKIYRDTVIERTANYPNTGPFSMPLLNDEQNKMIAILQELAVDVNQVAVNEANIAQNTTDIATNTSDIADNAFAITKAVRAPSADTAAQMELPVASGRLNKYLKFNGAGNVEVADVTGSGTVLSRSVISNFLWPQTAAELAAGITPSDEAYPPGNVLRYGAVADGVTDNTTAFNNAITGAEKGVVYFPYVGTSSYRTDRITMASTDSDKYIFLEPGVVLECTAGGTGIFRGNDADNISIVGYGATCQMAGQAGGSSNVNFSGGKNILIEGLRIIDSGASKDGIYIGVGGAGAPCENVTIRKCYLQGAERNQISIVGGVHVVIEDNEIAGGEVVNPGAGIDIEANTYNDIDHIVIRNNWIHDCLNYGIINAFGENGIIEGNLIEDIVNEAPILIGAGGGWDENGALHDVRRPISDYTLATGEVHINAPDNPPTPWPGQEPHPGQVASFITLNGKAKPTEHQVQTYFVIDSYDSVAGTVVLSTAEDWGVIDSLSDKGTAILSSDPAVTEQFLIIRTVGCASNWTVRNNKIRHTSSGEFAIVIGAGAVDCIVAENTIQTGPATGGIQFIYSEGCLITGNKVYGDQTSVNAFNKALSLSNGASNCVINDNYFVGYSEGLPLSGCLSNKSMNIGVIQNCGWDAGYAIDIRNTRNFILNGCTIQNDANDFPTTYGVGFYTTSTLTCGIIGCIIEVGSTDANAIQGLSAYESMNIINGKQTGAVWAYPNDPAAVIGTYQDFMPGATWVDSSPASGLPALGAFDGSAFLTIGAGQNSNAYTPTNVVTDRAYDANATTVDELADVLGTLIADLKSAKIIS